MELPLDTDEGWVYFFQRRGSVEDWVAEDVQDCVEALLENPKDASSTS